MKYYCIKVGKTREEVLNDNFLWAPKPYENESGRKINNSGWTPLAEMVKGDVAFLIFDGVINEIATALSDAYSSLRPKSRKFEIWKKEGYRVDVQLTRLSTPIDFRAIAGKFVHKFPDSTTPKLFTPNNTFTETYSNRLTMDAGKYLLALADRKSAERIQECMALVLFDAYPQKHGNSWTLLSEVSASKQVDITLKRDFETGVPKSMLGFFFEEPLRPGSSISITLVVNDNSFDIPIRRKQDGRHVMNLKALSSELLLMELEVSSDSIWLERNPHGNNSYWAYTSSETKSLRKPPRQRVLPSQTSASRSVEARVGQDYFRAEVQKVCKSKCVVTGVEEQYPSILIASHIKPWSQSNDEERMDGHNGLLLSPHIDKLFDKHLISFSEDGTLLVSSLVPESVLEAWNIDLDRRFKLTKKNKKYLIHHRTEFDLKND